MFFLFGWGHRTTKDEGPTLSTRCQNCGNDVWLHLTSSKTWFSLFLVPVIPYELKSWLICPVCSRGFELEGAEMLVRARQFRALSAALISGEMAEEQYLLDVARLEQPDQLNEIAPPTAPAALPAAPVPRSVHPAPPTTSDIPREPRSWTWRAWLGLAAGGAILIWVLFAAVAEDRARAGLNRPGATNHVTESRQP